MKNLLLHYDDWAHTIEIVLGYTVLANIYFAICISTLINKPLSLSMNRVDALGEDSQTGDVNGQTVNDLLVYRMYHDSNNRSGIHRFTQIANGEQSMAHGSTEQAASIE